MQLCSSQDSATTELYSLSSVCQCLLKNCQQYLTGEKSIKYRNFSVRLVYPNKDLILIKICVF